jgi:hypothetical protein
VYLYKTDLITLTISQPEQASTFPPGEPGLQTRRLSSRVLGFGRLAGACFPAALHCNAADKIRPLSESDSVAV